MRSKAGRVRRLNPLAALPRLGKKPLHVRNRRDIACQRVAGPSRRLRAASSGRWIVTKLREPLLFYFVFLRAADEVLITVAVDVRIPLPL